MAVSREEPPAVAFGQSDAVDAMPWEHSAGVFADAGEKQGLDAVDFLELLKESPGAGRPSLSSLCDEGKPPIEELCGLKFKTFPAATPPADMFAWYMQRRSPMAINFRDCPMAIAKPWPVVPRSPVDLSSVRPTDLKRNWCRAIVEDWDEEGMTEAGAFDDEAEDRMEDTDDVSADDVADVVLWGGHEDDDMGVGFESAPLANVLLEADVSTDYIEDLISELDGY